MNYSYVVSSYSVRIALTISAINDLEILARDIQNAYLTKEYRELVWIVAGTEYISEAGQCMLVNKA